MMVMLYDKKVAGTAVVQIDQIFPMKKNVMAVITLPNKYVFVSSSERLKEEGLQNSKAK